MYLELGLVVGSYKIDIDLIVRRILDTTPIKVVSSVDDKLYVFLVSRSCHLGGHRVDIEFVLLS